MEAKTCARDTRLGIEKPRPNACDTCGSTAWKLDNASTLDDAHAG